MEVRKKSVDGPADRRGTTGGFSTGYAADRRRSPRAAITKHNFATCDYRVPVRV